MTRAGSFQNFGNVLGGPTRNEEEEAFIASTEVGMAKLKRRSILAAIIASLLTAAYLGLLVFPFSIGSRYILVGAFGPTFLVQEATVLSLTFAFIYAGTSNYIYITRLGQEIRKVRDYEAKLERWIESGDASLEPQPQ